MQCSPEDREEVIHIFQTVFDPRVPLKDVPHFVTWSFMQDIHEENAESHPGPSGTAGSKQ